jgi:small subunit ribosomal protein S16e
VSGSLWIAGVIMSSEAASKVQAVQVFGRKKNAVAVAHTKAGKGVLKVNGSPIQLLQPDTLRVKAMEPILVLGKERFANLDIRVRVRGGGYTAQAFGTWESEGRLGA